MLSQYLTLLLLTGIVFAIPQPQDADELIATGIYSDMPTLPLSIYQVLETAVPADVEATMTGDYSCDPTTVPFFKKLPSDVQTALVSYNSALQSWALAHVSEFEDGVPTYILNCMTTTANPKDSAGVTGGPIAGDSEVTGLVTTVGGAVETGSVSITGGASKTGSSTITSVASGSASGVAAGASVSRSGTSVTGGSVTTSQSPGAAPRAPGAIVGSLAGLVGALGVVALL